MYWKSFSIKILLYHRHSYTGRFLLQPILSIPSLGEFGSHSISPLYMQEKAAALEGCLKDGEDQDRHLLDMPFSAFGMLAAEDIAKFQAQNRRRRA